MILYNISFIDKNGLRTLLGPAQGRYMCEKRADVEAGLVSMLKNSEERLVEICGPQSRGTFRVDPFECWDNGDPKGIYVRDDMPKEKQAIQPLYTITVGNIPNTTIYQTILYIGTTRFRLEAEHTPEYDEGTKDHCEKLARDFNTGMNKILQAAEALGVAIEQSRTAAAEAAVAAFDPIEDDKKLLTIREFEAIFKAEVTAWANTFGDEPSSFSKQPHTFDEWTKHLSQFLSTY